ncbi:MAG: MarR family transcriptional regulator, partial [Bdellovibrionales bacterium]|nr:MarR family transcriptional regulator [Bdellovibrionales bacterium]
PLSWHILEEIAERTSARSDPTTPGYLSSALSCPPTKISFALNALEKRGWINRAPHPQDRRSSLLTLTTEGEELLQEIRSQGAALVSRGFRALTDSDSKTLLKLFGHIAGDSSPGPEIVLQAKRSLRFATTHKERALLRRFAIENTYSTNQELEIPESLFSAESNNVALLENDELEACIEYTSSKNHLTIHSFAVHQGKETKLSDCLEAIITHETDATSPRPKQLEISTHLYSLTESKILIQKFGDRQAK